MILTLNILKYIHRDDCCYTIVVIIIKSGNDNNTLKFYNKTLKKGITTDNHSNCDHDYGYVEGITIHKWLMLSNVHELSSSKSVNEGE